MDGYLQVLSGKVNDLRLAGFTYWRCSLFPGRTLYFHQKKSPELSKNSLNFDFYLQNFHFYIQGSTMPWSVKSRGARSIEGKSVESVEFTTTTITTRTSFHCLFLQGSRCYGGGV